MSNMFQDCSKLTGIDLSSFNTEKVQNMANMFESCISLTSLDVSKFNTKEVKDMTKMFEYLKLTSLDLNTLI